MTLIKRPGSPYFIACFDIPTPDGKIRRLKKSTKQTKRSEALTEGQRLEALERKRCGAENDVKADKAFSILAAATDAAAKGELSEARARALIAELAECSTGDKLRFCTVRQWAAEWLGMKAATSKAPTLKKYRCSVSAFLGWIGDKADGRLEAVTKSDARAFRDAMHNGWNPPGKKSNGKISTARRTARSANQFARYMSGMFRAAVRENLLIASPFTALEGLPEIDSMEREIFTIAEVGELVATAGKQVWQAEVFSKHASEEEKAARSRDWQGLILLGFYGGPRLGDGARFKKAAVNLTDKYLAFMPEKTDRKKKKLEVPIHSRLAEWLEGQLQVIEDAEFLFPALCRAPISGKAGLSSQFVAIMNAAGIDRKTVRPATEGRKAQHSRSYHALRHSLTSALANSDVSPEIRRKIVGHDSAAVHQVYTHHERKTLAEALEKLPAV